jgi:hypothetical protein
MTDPQCFVDQTPRAANSTAPNSCKQIRLLDCHQQRVVQAELDRDLCVLAGAGAGKTHAVTYRIERLRQHSYSVR